MKFPRISVVIAIALGIVVGTAFLLQWSPELVGAPPASDAIEIWPIGDSSDIEELARRDDVNVLFILVDTLRADRMSAYGYERQTTPRLDRLARFGVRFEHHLAQSSWTKSSMASLWTGFHPPRTGILKYDDIIPDAAVMPAEVFAEAGFKTVGLYRNGWVAPTFGFDQGFEVYSKPPRRPPKAELQRDNPTLSSSGSDEDIIEAATEFLQAFGRERWFLYLHLMDVHEYTYGLGSALFGSGYGDIYDNSIHWTDETIDIFLGRLMEAGYLNNTLVVLTSDHGEAFRERGDEGHARSVYRETTEIPLVMLFPFRLHDGGAVVSTRTQNVDLWPTVYDLLGIDAPILPESPDGRSLVPDILQATTGGAPRLDEEGTERLGFSFLNQNWGQRSQGMPRSTYAVVKGRDRYVRRDAGSHRYEELFDAAADPRELASVAGTRRERLEELRRSGESMAAARPVWGEPEAREISELQLNQLRALGYQLP